MSVTKLTNFINGEFVAPVSGKYLENINPSTNKLISFVPDSDERDVKPAILAAKKAQKKYKLLSKDERANLLYKIANLMESKEYRQRLILGDTTDMGKPISMMEGDLSAAIKQFRTYAQLILSISEPLWVNPTHNIYEIREPVGIVGIITPWNFPLMLFCMRVSAAISVGNAVICKPTEIAPTSALIMCEIFKEAGIPNGIINVINGYGHKAGEAITTNKLIRAISFTGGTVTGKRISKVASPLIKKIQLELGGKNSSIIFNDCYLNECIDSVLIGSLMNTGQVCCSSSRILVESGIYDKFIKLFITKVKEFSLTIGDPNNKNTMLGPLVSQTQYNKVIKYLKLAQQEGGRILYGGRYGSNINILKNDNINGFYVEPTIIEGLNDNCRCIKEEIFGPIVTIQKFNTEKEAITMANSVEYGLAGAVFTKDIRKADRISKSIDAGTIWINCYFEGDGLHGFGGYKKSGIGRDGGMHSIRFYTETKAIVSKL